MSEVQTIFEDVCEVELPGIELTEFEGQKVVIERMREEEGKFGPCVIVESAPICRVGDKDIRASRILGLVRHEGRVVWGAKSKTADFLKKYKVGHYSELVGVKAVVGIKVKEDRQFATLM
jgi:hypothetical protein